MSATAPTQRLLTVDRQGPPHMFGLSAADLADPQLGPRWRASKRLKLRTGPLDAASTLQLHRRAQDAHGSRALTLVIRNTVTDAQALYKALAGVGASEIPRLLLHSRFRPLDRRRAVDRLEEMAAEGGIVVATQVIEAGVDLDAHVLVTDLCPWASLVQRLGRLNRRGIAVTSCDAVIHLPIDQSAEEARRGAVPLDRTQAVQGSPD